MSGIYFRENFNNIKSSTVYKDDFWSFYKKENSFNSQHKNLPYEKSRFKILPRNGETVMKKFYDDINDKGLKRKSENLENIERNNRDNKNGEKKLDTIYNKNLKTKSISSNNFIAGSYKDSNDKSNLNLIYHNNLVGSNNFLKNDDSKKYENLNLKQAQEFQNSEIKIYGNDLNNDIINEENEEDIQNLIQFMSNLDFSIYVKDLHIREALHLIKNKIEKEAELEKTHIDSLENNQQLNDKQITTTINNMTKINSSTEPTNNKMKSTFMQNQFVPEKDWDNSIKQNNTDSFNIKDEQGKTEIAEKILKTDKRFRNVHSIQSVKKLLEREGITGEVKINPLRISILKEKAIIKDYQHTPSMLPNLRDLPLI